MKVYILKNLPNFMEETTGGILGVFDTMEKAKKDKEIFEGIGRNRKKEFEIEEWEIQ